MDEPIIPDMILLQFKMNERRKKAKKNNNSNNHNNKNNVK